MTIDISQRLTAYFGLCMPLAFAIKYYFQTILHGFSDTGDRTFATWYMKLGHECFKIESNTPVPRLVALASGTVLELGPAIGNQLSRFDSDKVIHIYGIEPNGHFIDVLQEAVDTHDGLKDKYTAIHGFLEDDALLEKYGILPGSLDSIVSIQVLCSVLDARDVAKRVHKLLKPGGKLIFWEHGRSWDGVTRVVQRMWSLLWTPLLGGCNLTRDVEGAIMSAGPWEVEELSRGEGVKYSMLPRVWGCLIKKKE